MIETKYFVFPAGKPEEKFEVLPHTFGDVNDDGLSDVAFAVPPAEGVTGDEWAADSSALYTWTNADKDGAFVNNDVEQLDLTGTFDIMREDTEVADETTTA